MVLPSIFLYLLAFHPAPSRFVMRALLLTSYHVSTASRTARSGIGENMELLLLCFTKWWIVWPCLIISKHIRRGQIFIPDLRPLIWWRPYLKAPSKEPFIDSVPSDVPSNEIWSAMINLGQFHTHTHRRKHKDMDICILGPIELSLRYDSFHPQINGKIHTKSEQQPSWRSLIALWKKIDLKRLQQ